MVGTALAILGVHPVVPSTKERKEAVSLMFGTDLTPAERAEAERAVQAHYGGLYLLEVSGTAVNEQLDWGQVTQIREELRRENWQADYDEQALRAPRSSWVFFFHELDLSRPLATPVGPIALPVPTPIPAHLKAVRYELP